MVNIDTQGKILGAQGESLPLWGTVEQLTDRLTAAGIGQRPVVFIAHRHALSPQAGGVCMTDAMVKAALQHLKCKALSLDTSQLFAPLHFSFSYMLQGQQASLCT